VKMARCEWFECLAKGVCDVLVAGYWHKVCDRHYMRFQGLEEDDLDLFSKVSPPCILPYRQSGSDSGNGKVKPKG
jgi:hypothetical protein